MQPTNRYTSTLCLKTILVLFISLPGLIPAAAQTRYERIDSVFQRLYEQGKFNGNVLIAEQGKVKYQKSFGLANETTKEPLSERSVFELASVSKQFTAMGIVLLSEQGKLRYDDLLSKYIPELGFYTGVTIRHLLHHTGGLPDYMGLMYLSWDKSRIATNQDVIDALVAQHPAAVFEPGSKFEYSNTGYLLLASVIERVSGQSFTDFMVNRIFKPLDMKQTLIYRRRYAPKEVPHYAYGYVYSDSLARNVLPDSLEDYRIVVWLDGVTGDGMVNSTAADLLKWDRALYKNKLVSRKAIEEIYAPAVLNDGSKSPYGYGWALSQSKDIGHIVSHSGGWPGYITMIERHPDKDKTIIILQNSERGTVPMKTVRNLLYDIEVIDPSARKEIEVRDAVLERYTGTYELAPGAVIEITRKGTQLSAQLTGQQAFEIYPESERMFFLKVVDAQMEFVCDDADQVTHLILHQNGEHQAKKIR